jgi:hypothetical protein
MYKDTRTPQVQAKKAIIIDIKIIISEVVNNFIVF